MGLSEEDKKKTRVFLLRVKALLIYGLFLFIGGFAYFCYGCVTKTGSPNKTKFILVLLIMGFTLSFAGLIVKIESRYLKKYLDN